MTLNVNTALPDGWADTPLTQWLVRNNVRTVNNFTVYTGIGWETGARIVRGYHSDYKMSARIRGKLLRLGIPKPIISAHQKPLLSCLVSQSCRELPRRLMTIQSVCRIASLLTMMI